jgi:protein-S-isoprenylcysteine O-methyltransferase Ste14
MMPPVMLARAVRKRRSEMNETTLGTSRLRAYFVLVLGYVFGAASLIWFGWFLWVGPHQIVDLKLGTPMALALDGLLAMAFFVQHSGMIRKSFRRRLAAVLPVQYHPAVFATASGVVLLLLLVLWQPSGVGVLSLDGPSSWLVRGVFLVGIAGLVWGVASLGYFDLFGRRAILAHLRGRPAQALPLTIRGPYRWVRHPLYASLLLLIWACPSVPADRLLFNVLWTVWIVVATLLEERDLAAEFGEAYQKYQRSVPMLVPWKLRPGN